jgi:hypothetical protein
MLVYSAFSNMAYSSQVSIYHFYLYVVEPGEAKENLSSKELPASNFRVKRVRQTSTNITIEPV